MHRYPILAALIALLPACADPASLPDGPYLHADVEGALFLTHHGGANWGGAGHDRVGAHWLYISSGIPDSHLRFEILAGPRIGQWFERETYSLDPRHLLGEDNEGNTAIHRIGSEWYIAESGTLTITDITAEAPREVSGTFELTAVFWCDRAESRESCLALPDEFSADRPRIRIRGSFRAAPEPEVPLFNGGGS